MKIYVASRNQETLDLWARLLPPSQCIEFVNYVERALRADAIIISGEWAFDRYGGSPDREVARIRPNMRNDGLPDWIVIPPYRPLAEVGDGTFKVRDDFRDVSPAYFGILQALRAIHANFGDVCSVILDLPLLGMDDSRDESTPRSAASAIGEFSEGTCRSDC